MAEKTAIDKFSILGEVQSEITKLKRLCTQIHRAKTEEEIYKSVKAFSMRIDELLMKYLDLKEELGFLNL